MCYAFVMYHISDACLIVRVLFGFKILVVCFTTSLISFSIGLLSWWGSVRQPWN